MSKYTFKIKSEDTYVFFDIVDDGDVPSLSFHFGTADAMEMDLELLGKLVAIANWKAIPIWAMANDNDGKYHTKITESIKVSHMDAESFFDVDDVEVDFKKYDVLLSNSDFRHQKEVEEW